MKFLFIILFHELGHILGAIYFKWNIEKIIILPFGGLTVFNEDINRSLKEEFIICILGPLFQVAYYFILKNFLDIKYIHYNLLLFNLIPIYPLDGSKILNIFFNKIFPFKNSLYLTYFLSFILIILLCYIKHFNLIFLLILVFLFFKNITELTNIKFIFNRFLLERYFKHYYFYKKRIIRSDNLNKMKKDYYHVFLIENKYVTEKEKLRKMFDLQGIL